jgi:hypothetical protein
MKNITELELDKEKYLQSIYSYIGLYNKESLNYKTNLYKFKLFAKWIDGLSEISYRNIQSNYNSRAEYIYRNLTDSWNPFFLQHDIFHIATDRENLFLQEKFTQSVKYVNKIHLSEINNLQSDTKFYLSYANLVLINKTNFIDSLKRIIVSVNNNNLNYFYHLFAFSKLSEDLLNSIVKKCELNDNMYALNFWVDTIPVHDVNDFDNEYETIHTILDTNENLYPRIYCNHLNLHFVNIESPMDIDISFTNIEPIGLVLDSYTDCYYYYEGNYYESEEYYEENYADKFIDSYHQGQHEQKAVLFDSASPYRIGFEIEKEDSDILEYCNIHEFKRKSDNLFRKERDGSVCDEVGFELITPIYELNSEKIHEHICSYYIIESHIDAEVNYETCGGHISISNINKDTWRFYSDIENYIPLFYAMYPKRCNENYCKAKTKSALKNDNEKYQAVKIHANRIEIRIFPAVKSVKQLMFRTKLLEIILNNPTDNYMDSYKVIKKQVLPYLSESGVYSADMIKRLVLRMKDSYAKYGFNEMDFDIETDYESEYFDN